MILPDPPDASHAMTPTPAQRRAPAGNRQARRGLGRRAAALLVVLGALAACGGGVSTLDPFEPTRILVYGDETALINADGSKFTINAIDSATPPARVCGSAPVWTQYLAQSYGMDFAACVVFNQATPSATMNAVAQARAADVADALLAFVAANRLSRGDLFAVSAGQNDVIAAYEQYAAAPATFTSAQAVAQVEAAAARLAAAIDAVANANGRIIFSTVPEFGLSPYAQAKGSADAGVIAQLVVAFNTTLRTSVANNGRRIGMVQADAIMQVIHENRADAGVAITNTSDPACDDTHRGTALPTCTTATLTTAATGLSGAFMWADDRYVTPAVHAQIGAAAVSLARGNPF